MPRVSREQSESHRRLITEAAARLFRERGVEGVSVAEAMGAAGLTHGGFYGHFDSKDGLAAEACAVAFEQSAQRWTRRLAGRGGRGEALAAVAGPYLAARSRDNPGSGCPVAALAADCARLAPAAPMRQSYAKGVERLVDLLGAAYGGEGARARALADLALMAGALMMARAASGLPLSDEILAAARAAAGAAK